MNGCNNKTQNIPKTRSITRYRVRGLVYNGSVPQKDVVILNVCTPNSRVQTTWVRDWIQWSWFSSFLQGEGLMTQFLILGLIFLSQWWGQRWAEASWTPWPHSVLSVVSTGVLPVSLRRQALGLCDRSPYMELPQGRPPLLATEHFLESAALTWNASQRMGV